MPSSDPEVTRAEGIPPLKWGPPDEEGLVQFLVREKSFAEDRVRKVVERIRGSRGKSNQGEMPNSHVMVKRAGSKEVNVPE